MLKAYAVAVRSVLLVLLLAPGTSTAQESADVPHEDPSKHRLDFSYIEIDSRFYSSSIWGLGYAYSLTPYTNLAVSVPVLDLDFNRDHNAGIGDTSVSFSWTPLQAVSVRPWVPKQVGTGIEVSLPTGDPDSGLGLDTAVVTPFLGLTIPLTDRFTLLPYFLYSHSVNETAQGSKIRFAAFDLGVNFLQNYRWWVTVYGAYLYDLEVRKDYWNAALTVGMLFNESWGGSIEFSSTQHFEPGVVTGPFNAVDGQFLVNLHYNF